MKRAKRDYWPLAVTVVVGMVYLGVRSVVRAPERVAAVIPGALRLLVAPGYVVHFMIYGVHGGTSLSRAIIVEAGSTLFWSFVILTAIWLFWRRGSGAQ